MIIMNMVYKFNIFTFDFKQYCNLMNITYRYCLYEIIYQKLYYSCASAFYVYTFYISVTIIRAMALQLWINGFAYKQKQQHVFITVIFSLC